MSKREIHIVIEVSDHHDYDQTVALVAASLFKGNAWLPGFLFQSHFKNWRMELRRERDEPSS